MFCPVCKSEYRPGFTHCADCDVDLVETLDVASPHDRTRTAASERSGSNTPRMLWSGIDNAAFDEIRSALDKAEIPYNDEPLEAGLLYSSLRNPLEIWVHRSDYDDARKIVSEVFGRDPNDDPAFTMAPGDSIEGSENYALGWMRAAVPNRGSGDAPGIRDAGLGEYTDDARIVGEPDWQNEIDTVENFDREEATLEVWHGNDAMLAQVLGDCLRENRIGSNLDRSDPNSFRLFVYPVTADRAREIVRQVVEGVPPE